MQSMVTISSQELAHCSVGALRGGDFRVNRPAGPAPPIRGPAGDRSTVAATRCSVSELDTRADAIGPWGRSSRAGYPSRVASKRQPRDSGVEASELERYIRNPGR